MVAKINPVHDPCLEREQYIEPTGVNFAPLLRAHAFMREQKVGSALSVRCQFEAGRASEVVHTKQVRLVTLENPAAVFLPVGEAEENASPRLDRGLCPEPGPPCVRVQRLKNAFRRNGQMHSPSNKISDFVIFHRFYLVSCCIIHHQRKQFGDASAIGLKQLWPGTVFAIVRFVPTSSDIILRLQGLSKVYPGTVALKDVDLAVRRGETHGIIGKNGAGKTTLVGIVAGLVSPSAGAVEINGHDHTRLTRIGARKAGVAIVPQEPQLVQQASIAENLFLPEYLHRGHGLLVTWQKMYNEANEILRRGGLNVDARTTAGDIGIGIQQIILMLKAAYVDKAEIIILDEAFASLSEREEKIFYELIRERKDAGCTILHISHRISELLSVCDRMTVLRDGASIGTVTREEVDKDSLARLIVGEEAALEQDVTPSSNRAGDEDSDESEDSEKSEHPRDVESRRDCPVLDVRGLTLAERFLDVNFSVKQNEVLGLAGLIGSGRTSILKAIFGLEPIDDGTVVLNGREVTLRNPADALRNGVVYLPGDRDLEGLITNLSVKDNLLLSALKRVSGKLFVDRARERVLASELAKQLALHFASFDQEVSELSGGNRQKVVVGKVLSTEPRVFLLDEPTKGIDIAAKAGILRIIRDGLRSNSAVVVTSPGLDDLIEICDRIAVVHDGRILGTFGASEFQEERLYKAIQGNLEQQQAQV